LDLSHTASRVDIRLRRSSAADFDTQVVTVETWYIVFSMAVLVHQRAAQSSVKQGTHLFVGRTRGAHLISLSQWLNLFGQIADDLELKFIAHAILLPFGDDLHHTFDVNKKANAQRPKNVLWNLDFKRRNTLMRRE
jgi:hypothetical protein